MDSNIKVDLGETSYDIQKRIIVNQNWGQLRGLVINGTRLPGSEHETIGFSIVHRCLHYEEN
jgi:hypothetical protein